jgi:hypothetical protein
VKAPFASDTVAAGTGHDPDPVQLMISEVLADEIAPVAVTGVATLLNCTTFGVKAIDDVAGGAALRALRW